MTDDRDREPGAKSGGRATRFWSGEFTPAPKPVAEEPATKEKAPPDGSGRATIFWTGAQAPSGPERADEESVVAARGEGVLVAGAAGIAGAARLEAAPVEGAVQRERSAESFTDAVTGLMTYPPPEPEDDPRDGRPTSLYVSPLGRRDGFADESIIGSADQVTDGILTGLGVVDGVGPEDRGGDAVRTGDPVGSSDAAGDGLFHAMRITAINQSAVDQTATTRSIGWGRRRILVWCLAGLGLSGLAVASFLWFYHHGPVPTVDETSRTTIPTVTKTETAPTKTETAPSKTEAAPSKTEAAPSKTEAAPSKTEAAPTKAEAAPTKAESAPTRSPKAATAVRRKKPSSPSAWTDPYEPGPSSKTSASTKASSPSKASASKASRSTKASSASASKVSASKVSASTKAPSASKVSTSTKAPSASKVSTSTKATSTRKASTSPAVDVRYDQKRNVVEVVLPDDQSPPDVKFTRKRGARGQPKVE